MRKVLRFKFSGEIFRKGQTEREWKVKETGREALVETRKNCKCPAGNRTWNPQFTWLMLYQQTTPPARSFDNDPFRPTSLPFSFKLSLKKSFSSNFPARLFRQKIFSCPRTPFPIRLSFPLPFLPFFKTHFCLRSEGDCRQRFNVRSLLL